MVRRYRPTPAPSEANERSDGGRCGQTAKGDNKKTEVAAVRLLARREHSTRGLKRKLVGKGHASPAVDAVLAHLTSKHLLSDERFVASFVHHHTNRGQGPVRIRAELRQQGIADEMVGAALDRADFDWGRLAADARQRKFGASPPKGLAERAKQSRFLQYRGFTTDQIRTALTMAASGHQAGSDEDAMSGLQTDDLDAGDPASGSGLDFDP